MTREEFEKAVKAMQAEGVPLSMPNLMVRTELPRGQIEEWLAEMDKGVRSSESTASKSPVAAKGAGRGTTKTAVGEALDELEKLKARADEFRQDLVDKATDKVVKETLGVDIGTSRKKKKVSPKARKDLRIAGGLGLLGGPFGLFYAAPMLTAGIFSVLYVAVVVTLFFVPLLGTAVLFYVVPPVHLVSAAVSAAYAWRYNRSGARSALIPGDAEKDD